MVCERRRKRKRKREREREPEITQVYDVKTKLKGEKEKKERKKKNRKRKKKGEEKTKSRRRLLRREASFVLSSFPSDEFLVWARGAHPSLPLPSPCLFLFLSLSLGSKNARETQWRSGCLRGCIHNGTGQNNSRDVFGRVGASEPFPTPRRIVSTIKEQRKRHTEGIFEKEDVRGTAKRFQHLGNRFVGTKNLRERERGGGRKKALDGLLNNVDIQITREGRERERE